MNNVIHQRAFELQNRHAREGLNLPFDTAVRLAIANMRDEQRQQLASAFGLQTPGSSPSAARGTPLTPAAAAQKLSCEKGISLADAQCAMAELEGWLRESKPMSERATAIIFAARQGITVELASQIVQQGARRAGPNDEPTRLAQYASDFFASGR